MPLALASMTPQSPAPERDREKAGGVPIMPVNMSGKVAFKTVSSGFPGSAVVENPPANAGHTGSIPGPGRSHMPRSS